MRFNQARPVRWSLSILAPIMLFTACDEATPLPVEPEAAIEAQFAKQVPQREIDHIVRTLRKATDRYHNIDNAIDDGFVFVHDCEVRPGEDPAGMVFAHPTRMGDGLLRAGLPDGLLYEPSATGKPKLVGVEMIMPYALWTKQTPPTFLGQTFQAEDEFGVFGLHVWVWRDNPNGLFGLGNPNVNCDA
jgi:hypothetical protein